MIRQFTPSACTVLRTAASTALCVLLTIAPAAAQTRPDSQPRSGGTLRMAILPQPTTLNPYFSTDITIRLLDNLNLEGLSRVAFEGSLVPVLAAEIPTQANGDVSPDGRLVTWRLKPGVVWSDG